VACSGNDAGLFRATGPGNNAPEAGLGGEASSVETGAGGAATQDGGDAQADAAPAVDGSFDGDASLDADASSEAAAGAGGSLSSGGASGGPSVGGSAGTSASGGAGGGGGSAGAAGNGGSAGSGGTCAKTCDCDGDGYLAAGAACGGDDCDDHNADVHPGQTAYFDVPTESGSFDYNCSGSVEHQYGSTLTCLPVLCPGGEGYFGALPACGASAAWGDCVGALCSEHTLEQRREGCH
jgi:hypothetical protein